MNVKKINSALHGMGNYHDKIPLDKIFSACEAEGLVPVMEDGERWAGMLCGENSRAVIELARGGKVKKYLSLSWYKMPSGRYEVVSYVS
jgi:hypothetical protein